MEEWNSNREMFLPDDGSGYFGTLDHYSPQHPVTGEQPGWATHIAWFNK
jgi:hypothetical protein